MATIKEIAAIAGVSRGTVDRVLNNRGSVNPETEKRIREIAERMNYQPNKAGLMLAARKKNYKIGVLLFSDSNLFFDDIFKGITAKATELLSYNLSIITERVPFDENAQLQAINRLVEQEINGLLLVPYNAPSIEAKINELEDMQIPVVTVNTDIHSNRLAYVGCDFYRSGVTAAGLVGHMTHGDVNIGIVTGSFHVLSHTERVQGFEARIKEAYPNLTVIAIEENHDDDVESYKIVSTLLENHPEVNCLFFTAGGVSGGCKAICDSNHRNEISVFSYDNISTTVEYVKRGIITATICQQPYQQGYQALEILSRYLLENVSPDTDHLYLDIDIRLLENI